MHLVNRRGGEVLGRPSYRSLAELPDAPELVVLAVPPAAVEQAVDDALAAGARAIVAITAGEADGDAGGARDAALAARVRAAGAVLLGPNCMGVFDAGSELELAAGDLPPGAIGLVSQSGNLALELGLLAADAGLGFSRFVSLGNQADLEAVDLVRDLAEHDATELIAVYVEDFRDGRAFAAAAQAARAAGKHVVLLAIEHTEATARAVRSHTGALASDAAAIDAACRAAGIERVRAPQEMIDLAEGLLRAGRPAGRRIAVLADGGGHGGVAAGLAHTAGLELPALGPATVSALRARLPATAAAANPVDLAGGGEQDIRTFDHAARALLDSGEVDALLITGYFGGYSEYGEAMARAEISVAEALGDAVRTTGRPLVVHSMYGHNAATEALRQAGVPVYRTVERAVATLARLARAGEPAPEGVPDVPPPARPITDDGYAAARALLAAGGVPFAPAETATDADAAVAAAHRVGYPVVLKALGLPAQVRRGRRRPRPPRRGRAPRRRRRRPRAPRPARALGRAHGADRRRDRAARRRAARRPLRPGRARRPRRRLRRGARRRRGRARAGRRGPGRAHAPLAPRRRRFCAAPAAGRRSTSAPRPQALAALSRVAAAHPEIAEIEVNPLLALPDGALGLDARIVLAAPPEAAP